MEHSPLPGRSFEIRFPLYPGATLLDVVVFARAVSAIAHAQPIEMES